MKQLFILAATAAALSFISCGASKKALTSNYQGQWQQQQAPMQRPTRTLRTVDPCIEMANASPRRAYGTATSYVEKVALNEAARDARNQLAQMMKVAIEGAAQDYEQNATQNLKSSAETISEAIMTQFVDEEIKNTRTIKTSIYDLSDGSVQVYVCVEMCSSDNDFQQKLENTLDKNDIISIQYDRDRFIKSIQSGLDEYKKRNRQEE